MLLNVASAVTQTNCPFQSKEFTIKASPVAFDILASKLYANPILAIVRELLTNAYDSQKAAGTKDKPIKVNIPTYIDPMFTIRDYGLGLAEEDVVNLYTTFFDSTKSNTNDFTGCFGLGSKTPFSYTDSFSVHSYFNGKKYSFLAIKENGYPSIIKLGEEETTEPNGLEICIPVDKNDASINKFNANLHDYLKFIPEIQVDSNVHIERIPYSSAGMLSFYESRLYRRIANIYLKQGQNVYNLTEDAFDILREHAIYLSEMRYHFDVIINVPIGTVSITPNREHIAKDDKNVDALIRIIQQAETELENLIVSGNFKTLAEVSKKLFYEVYSKILTDKYIKNTNTLINGSIRVSENSNETCFRSGFRCAHMLKYSHTNEKLDTSQNASVCNNVPTKIIIHTNKLTRTDLTKIRNISNNYNLSDTHLLFLFVYQEDTCKCMQGHLHSLLHRIRIIKDLAWILNEIPEFRFDVEVLTFNKFKRIYPNHKKAKSTTPKTSAINIRNTVYAVHVPSENDTSQYRNNARYVTGHNYISSIDQLHKAFTKTDTILLPTSSNTEENIEIRNGLKAMVALLDCPFEFIRSYLKNLLQVQELPDIVYFISVAKTNRVFFKDYPQFNVEDLKQHIITSTWKYRVNYPYRKDRTTSISAIVSKLQNFEEIIKTCYKPKIQKVIFNSYFYKKLEHTQRLIKTFMNMSMLSPDAEGILIDFLGESIMKTKRVPNILIKAITKYTSTDFITYCDRGIHQIFDYKTQCHQWKLTTGYRHDIFDIIRKEEKNVLLSIT